MAPHDTNLERQKKKHAVPLVGMIVVVVLAFLGLFLLIGWVMDEPGGTEDEAVSQAPAPAMVRPALAA